MEKSRTQRGQLLVRFANPVLFRPNLNEQLANQHEFRRGIIAGFGGLCDQLSSLGSKPTNAGLALLSGVGEIQPESGTKLRLWL